MNERLVVKFDDTYFFKEDPYSIGTELTAGRHYASIPVSNGIVNYEEGYEITPEQYRFFLCDSDAAVDFVESGRRREHDDLLIHKRGGDRGIPA